MSSISIPFKVLIWLSIAAFIQGCATFEPNALDYNEVTADNMEAPMEYGVYTPPNWNPKESLPLIVFLHGGGDSHTSFEQYGGHQYFDQQITEDKMPRVILVTPNGRLGFWENWVDGSQHYRDWVLNNVMPKAQKDYNIAPCPTNCHLMGISMGGAGVLRFAYFASDQFSSLSAISAPIIEKDENGEPILPWLLKLILPVKKIFGDNTKQSFAREEPFNAWVTNQGLQSMRLQLIWGDQDREGIRGTNQRFHQHLETNNIPHDAYEYTGNHKWVSWIPNFNRVVNFLVNPNYQPPQ